MPKRYTHSFDIIWKAPFVRYSFDSQVQRNAWVRKIKKQLWASAMVAGMDYEIGLHTKLAPARRRLILVKGSGRL